MLQINSLRTGSDNGPLSTGPTESSGTQSDTDAADRHSTTLTDGIRPFLAELFPTDLLLCDILDSADGHSVQ